MVTVYGLAAFRPEVQGLIRDIRVIWALEELGMPYQRVVMDVKRAEHKKPEYLAINPFGKVPSIIDDKVTLFESSAICAYLGDKEAKLLPEAGTRERLFYNQWVSYITSTFEPLASRIGWLDLFVEQDETTKKLSRSTLELVKTHAKVLDARLQKQEYLLNDEFSLADVQLASVSRIVSHREPWAELPAFSKYLEKCFARPAYARAWAST